MQTVLRTTVLILTWAGLAGPLSAQVALYRASADTVYRTRYHPVRLYWVQGGDTVGKMIPSVTVTAERWRADGAGFVVATRDMDLDLTRKVHTDTLRVTASGRVTVPPGRGATRAVDFTLHLPIGGPRLTPGFSWSDTTSTPETGSAGPTSPGHQFNVDRTLHVTRAFDTLGAHVVEIRSDGTVHYADSWWADTGPKSYSWIDVRGQTHEMFWFDATAGRLVARRWQMSLVGLGGRPTPTGTDTTPAGLTASESERVILPEVGRILTRALPGADTTYTFGVRDGKRAGMLFLHTERFDTTGGTVSLESGFSRVDGLVGTVHATFDRGRVRSYDATWTDSSARPVKHHLVVQDEGVILHEDRTLDTLPLPPVDTVMMAPHMDWAVADYAMDELMAPILRLVGRDTVGRPIAVFRPTARRWDTVLVRVAPVGSDSAGPLLAAILGRGAIAATILITSADGVLLLSQDMKADGQRRGPCAPSRVSTEPCGPSRRSTELKGIADATRTR